jgi:hypothetical protein
MGVHIHVYIYTHTCIHKYRVHTYIQRVYAYGKHMVGHWLVMQPKIVRIYQRYRPLTYLCIYRTYIVDTNNIPFNLKKIYIYMLCVTCCIHIQYLHFAYVYSYAQAIPSPHGSSLVSDRPGLWQPRSGKGFSWWDAILSQWQQHSTAALICHWSTSQQWHP